jgi:hypothetical protein
MSFSQLRTPHGVGGDEPSDDAATFSSPPLSSHTETRTRPPLDSPGDSESYIGPLDMIPTHETRPHFEQDVDLNHAELNVQQVEAERQMQEDLRRREREIEARLATLRAKGRGVYA